MAEWQTAFASLNVSNPLVAWLVYRGEMVSSPQAHERALSFWITRYLAAEASSRGRADFFRGELALEKFRMQHHADVVSRLVGFYVFEDEPSAHSATQRWRGPFRPDTLVEVALRPGTRTSRHDAEWISQRLGAHGPTDWMDAYLRGQPSGPDPIWEFLVDGRAVILGTDLREAAYDVIRETWPASLALLELSRLGVELDSDLGLITAMLLGDGGDFRVHYVMNFADATNPAFLERLAKFEGPRNTADLEPESELVVPDLRDRSFTLLR
jgi:hypothetical protein